MNANVNSTIFVITEYNPADFCAETLPMARLWAIEVYNTGRGVRFALSVNGRDCAEDILPTVAALRSAIEGSTCVPKSHVDKVLRTVRRKLAL